MATKRSPKRREEHDRFFRNLASLKQPSYCAGKQKYESRRIAAEIGTELAVRSGSSLYAYRCRHCGGWHLTRNERTGGGVSVKFNVLEITGESHA